MPTTLQLYVLTALSAILRPFRPSDRTATRLWLWIDTVLLALVDFLRLFAGRVQATGLEKCARPEKPLVLYEPSLRDVLLEFFVPFRTALHLIACGALFSLFPYDQTLSVLAIDHYVYPCPRETLKSPSCMNSRYRPEVQKCGGALRFPFLVDPNTGRKLFESDDIIKYLWTTYGAAATAPLNYTIAHSPLYRSLSLRLCAFCRPFPDMGLLRAPSYCPETSLELWGYESSCFVRRVREVLTMLELPYLYHEIPKGALEKREKFRATYRDRFSQKKLRDVLGLIQVPLLVDPKARIELFESADIVAYLRGKYQTAAVPLEAWREFNSHEHKKTN